MAKQPLPLPDIIADLDPRPRHRLPAAPVENVEPSDEPVEANTAQMTKRWSAVTKARGEGAPRERPEKPEKLTPIQINIPPALNQQLARACFEQGCTKTYLIIKALAAEGFDVDPVYLSPDRRKPKA
ncbi:MAG: hypothetical protein PHI71_07105 [Acidiphilium sp.]|nr:hypothetical protein [Acidiphilium sp.]